MSNFFQARGKLSISQSTDKFQPFTEYKSESGWNNPRLIFNLIENGYRHSLQVGGDKNSLYKNDESNTIYTKSAATFDASGQKISDGENMEVPFSQRNDYKIVSRIANFNKYILDLNTPSERAVLKKMKQKLAEGETLVKADFDLLGVEDLDSAKVKIAELNKKRMEFIHAKDYIDAIMTMVNSGKYTDKHFYIPRGRFNYSYSIPKERFYENLEPVQIYLDDEDEGKVEFCTANIDFYFGPNAVDGTLMDQGKLIINGWIKSYESSFKEDVYVPKTIVFKCDYATDLGKAQANFVSDKYQNDTQDDLWVIPTDVSIIDGAERKEIKEEDLPDDCKQMIALGFKTFEDVKKELGGYVRGDSIHEWVWLPKINAKVEKELGFKVSDTVLNVTQNKSDKAIEDNQNKEDSSEAEFEALFKM